MISENGNYLSEDDIEMFEILPKEYFLTNTFLNRNQHFPGKNLVRTKGLLMVSALKKTNKEVLEHFRRSENSPFLDLDQEENSGDMRNFLAN